MPTTEANWDETWKDWEAPAWPAYTQIRIDWFQSQCRQLAESGHLAQQLVVEVGAGSGWVTKILAAELPDSRYVCSDISQLALSRIGGLDLPNVELLESPKLETLMGQAKLVICGDVLEHVEDKTGFVHSLGQLLRPGGLLLLSTPNLWFPPVLIQRLRGREATNQPYDRPLTSKQIARLLQAGGFELEELRIAKASSPPDFEPRPVARSLVRSTIFKSTGLILRAFHIRTDPAILVRAGWPH